MLPIKRPGRTLVAAAATALLLATAPAAMGATGTLNGSINPNKGPIGSPVNLRIGFTIAPDPGRERPIIRQVDLYFPPNARTNGAKFPSCTPEVINARKSFAGCPKGSKIGTGLAMADVPATDVFNVPARLTIFNGPGGRSVTIHVDAQNPVVISLAYKAPLIKTKGRYGYHLVSPLPPALQEIADGWFAEVFSFKSSISATYKGIPYIQTTTACPKSLSVPIGIRFGFSTLDNRADAPASAESTIRCRR